MEPIKAANGQEVTEEMLDGWCAALDAGEWPEGWENRGPVTVGRPRLSDEPLETITFKVSRSSAQTIRQAAEKEGES